ncbi:O-methyltransferase [Streptomyces puniciscabiei]|uniref:O-methyltransferase n=1 Tax=Streptomyces puniciscabiei TaxID=164348 RepID=A0A542SXB9_9ACTN|nr:methyltransferase [Streptomyces puniciscabiei]TQK79243.1 O-methyltransferase [Streptomyces puniciscabiei]
MTTTPTGPLARPEHVLEQFRDLAVGPTRFMTVYACYELGVLDHLRKNDGTGVSAAQMAAVAGIRPDAVEQLLHLLVKEDFVVYDESTGGYRAGGLARLSDDEFARAMRLMTMIKEVCLRQLYHLADSVRTGTVVGLEKIFGFHGNLYEACAEHDELRTAWSAMMDQTTSLIDPWFFENVDIEHGSRVLDLAGHTGLGAILTCKYNPEKNLQVACFDFPEKRDDALENFRAHGVEESCSFIGGDVFDGLPEGFGVVLVKHFLDQLGKENVFRVLRAVYECLEPGGRIYALVPTYPEDVKDSSQADFFPAYFLGCSTAEGGPQKVSTYKQWMEECGFTAIETITHESDLRPPEMIHVHSILCGVKE